jgi:hypothetical protein
VAVGREDVDIPADPVAYTNMAAKAAQIAIRLGASLDTQDACSEGCYGWPA